MNDAHITFLASPEWAALLEKDLLPWVDSVGDLGDDVLEVGPGPGLTTDLLRDRVRKLTAIEIDEALATALAARLGESTVDVVRRDATDSGLASGGFSAVTCFSMLHHMPSPELQDKLFGEVARVLRPGGLFIGVDTRDLDYIRLGHEGDTFVPVDPATLPDRLAAAGLQDATIDVGDYQIRFLARKPGE